MLKSSLSRGNDARKTKAQLIAELAAVRQRVSQLEAAEVIAHRPCGLSFNAGMAQRALRGVVEADVSDRLQQHRRELIAYT